MGLTKTVDHNLEVLGSVNAATLTKESTPVVISGDVDDIVETSQSAYDALGGGRPSGRLYLITS